MEPLDQDIAILEDAIVDSNFLITDNNFFITDSNFFITNANPYD